MPDERSVVDDVGLISQVSRDWQVWGYSLLITPHQFDITQHTQEVTHTSPLLLSHSLYADSS